MMVMMMVVVVALVVAARVAVAAVGEMVCNYEDGRVLIDRLIDR